MIYTSAQYLDPANTQSMPPWTRFDAGVRYAFERPDGKPVALRAQRREPVRRQLLGLGDQQPSASPMGAPRTFLLSVGTQF